MAYKKLKNGKIRIYGDHTIDGIRYRPSCTVKTNLTGLQLFQSAHPCRVRLFKTNRLCLIEDYFNPRTHKECDRNI